MVNPNETQLEFGCETCWPTSAEAAMAARSGLKTSAELIDESHFHVTICNCPACGQSFVAIFTETIDWADGEDPQYWTLMPITPEEATDLIRQGDAVSEARLNALGPGRRSLHHDHPKGASARSYWNSGIRIGWHD